MIKKIKKFLSFYKEADTIYNIHSPVVFEFMLDVFDTRKEYYIFRQIEDERNSFMTNHTSVNIEDLGAGSLTNSSTKRTISDIAINVVSNRKKCRMLFNLVNKYQPKNIIELGTSLGISTLYLSYACSQSNVNTVEGDKEIFTVADNLFHKNHINNINNYNATFEDALQKILREVSVIDIAYIDGNHSYDATMKYYETIKRNCNTKSIIVLDDIYWSDGMKQAWEEIKQKEEVIYTIDTFDLGFIFFDNVMPKQHFKLIEYWKKPFRIGLWG